MTVKAWEFPKVNKVAQPSVQSPDSLGSATQSKLSNLKQQASEEGYAAGLQQALNENQSTKELFSEKIEQLGLILNQFEAPLTHEFDVITKRLTQLSIAIAKKLVGDAIKQDPKVLEPFIQELLNQLPITSSSIHCYLSPGDLSLLKEDFVQATGADTKIEFFEDSTLSSGGCKILTGYTEIDASIEARLQELTFDLPNATPETETNDT